MAMREALRTLFEKLDVEPPMRKTTNVVHGEDGVTTGYDAAGVLVFSMPTEDYEGVLQWEEHEDRG